MHPPGLLVRCGSQPFPYRIDNHAVVDAPGGRPWRVRRGKHAAPAFIGDFEVTPIEGDHADDLAFLPIPTHATRIAAEPPVRALNRDLLQLRGRGDDHVTRAFDAIGSRPQNRLRRTPRAADLRENPASGAAGSRERRTRANGAAARLAGTRARPRTGRRGRFRPRTGHGKAAGPKPPDVALGVSLPLPASGQAGTAAGERRREPADGAIGQETYAAQSFIKTRRRSNRSLRR